MAKLYFYYSAMNAGKTTTLLQSAHNYRERGMRVAILTPRLDDRAGAGVVASRIGLRSEAVAFERDDDLERWIRDDIAAHGKLDCVLVDESQFLTRAQVWQLSEVVDALRIPVLCYGLRTDFKSRLFEGSARLMELADSIEEVKATCHFCNRKSIMNLKHVNGLAVSEGPSVELGAEEKYFPTCYKCYRREIEKGRLARLQNTCCSH